MTLVNFNGTAAVKWGATNLSRVYAGDVQVWPHPGPTPVSIDLEQGYAYVNNQINLTAGPRPLLPVYEIPLGSSINFTGSTTMRDRDTPIEASLYFLSDEAGNELGSLNENQARYSGTWTFPNTGIAEGDITTVKGYFTGTSDPRATWAVIKWVSAAGTFRRLPTAPTTYRDVTVDITGEVIPNFALSGILYRALNQSNPLALSQVTGYQDGTYRLVYVPPTGGTPTITWALDVAIEGRWWTTGMRPVDCTDATWSTLRPAWGGQIARSDFLANPLYSSQWTSPRSAGLVFDDTDYWRGAIITRRGSTIGNYHFNSGNALAYYGIALPAGLRMEDLPQFLLNTD